MKKNIYVLALAALGLALPAAAQNRAVSLEKATLNGRQCAAMEVLEAQIAADPAMGKRLAAIEAHTQAFVSTPAALRGTTATVTIPVVVHVVYNTAAQNVPQSQIDAQIRVLNEDFAKMNADASRVPSAFAGAAAATNVRFVLAQRDPNGLATTGVVRKSTKTRSFSSNDFVKYSSKGGSDAWPRDKYLNLWLCNLGQGLLGYAQFPGGAAATDGVVCLYSSTPGGAATNYNKGRTATHEIGHWLNLRHIWGDASCGNDLVSDTPTQQTSNGGCPAFPHVTCSNGPSGDMFMNYMDYTYDNCMYMFTAGQSARMDALFAAGGARAALLASNGGTAPRVATASAPVYSLYPNPATDVLNLRTGAATKANVSVAVYDLRGKELKNVRFDAATGQLDVRSLDKGIYRITINNGEQVTQQSFMKE
ncbi:T9SS type A sorting domain-containing protein [Hymenobacter busanensis]|uniref:T9SS type A sorting domain-containing protein n=1 Tax=Hymenobacter busanensis TaxID=2607656 RepID=A0A7L4ZXW6_9BACT|nr:M43 family zinc metalloprotease [Hymenobacter busanensis]KAA9333440.1 T9SS type A sorting domain-containing protein [Hymenobacter busanensis]QHJ07877.1 T9SS type A sorting domain-containing protein [Hymenobacter busanensis]